jgi:hypothetical protein
MLRAPKREGNAAFSRLAREAREQLCSGHGEQAPRMSHDAYSAILAIVDAS